MVNYRVCAFVRLTIGISGMLRINNIINSADPQIVALRRLQPLIEDHKAKAIFSDGDVPSAIDQGWLFVIENAFRALLERSGLVDIEPYGAGRCTVIVRDVHEAEAYLNKQLDRTIAQRNTDIRQLLVSRLADSLMQCKWYRRDGNLWEAKQRAKLFLFDHHSDRGDDFYNNLYANDDKDELIDFIEKCFCEACRVGDYKNVYIAEGFDTEWTYSGR